VSTFEFDELPGAKIEFPIVFDTGKGVPVCQWGTSVEALGVDELGVVAELVFCTGRPSIEQWFFGALPGTNPSYNALNALFIVVKGAHYQTIFETPRRVNGNNVAFLISIPAENLASIRSVDFHPRERSGQLFLAVIIPW
jgi:hypothetical protein